MQYNRGRKPGTKKRIHSPCCPKDTVVVYTDASLLLPHKGKKGSAAVGVYIPSLAITDGKKVNGTSSNEVEMRAILHGMVVAKKNGAENIIIKSDSRIAVNRANGRKTQYKTTSEMVSLQERIREYAKNFKFFTAVWVPRTLNKEADAMARMHNGCADGFYKILEMEL